MSRTVQLRISRVHDGRLEEFLSGWAGGVAPLRERFGFRVDGAWAAVGEDTFCWLLSHDGDEAAFREADARYYASPERAALDPDPARLLAETRTLFVRAALSGRSA